MTWGLSISAASFVAFNLLALFAALEMGTLLAARREPWRRLLVTSASYLLIAHLSVFVCGLAGMLTALPVFLTVLAAALVARFLNWRLRDSAVVSAPTSRRDPVQREQTSFAFLAYAVFFGVCGLRVMQAGLDGTTFTWDDLSYHGTEVAQWLADGRIGFTTFSYQTYYPFSSHLLLAWFMLPFGDDSYSSLTGLAWLGLTLVSIYSLTKDSKTPSWIAAVLAAIYLSSPALWKLASSFVAVDIATPALILAAVALVFSSSDRTRQYFCADLILGGLLVGLAVGSRATNAIPALVVLGWWVLESRKPGQRPGPIAAVLIFAAAASCTGAYWYLHNWVATGNPLFPAEFGPFDGPFDRGSQAQTTISSGILRGELSFRHLMKFGDWPVLTAIIAGIGYLCAGARLVWRRIESTQSSSGKLDLALFLIGGLTILLDPFVPFAGGMNRPESPLLLKQRFVVIAILCGLLLYRRLLGGGGRGAQVWLGLAALAVCESLWRLPGPALAWGVGLGALGLAARSAIGALGPRLERVPLSLIAATLVLVFLAAWQPIKAQRGERNIFAYGSPSLPVGRVWQQVDSLPPGSRIACFSSDPQEYTLHYPVFGRQLQHTPIAVDQDGSRMELLHRREQVPGADWWHYWERTAEGWQSTVREVSPEALVSNLEAASVEFVLVSRMRAGKPEPRVSIERWPPQQDLLRRSRLAREIYNDGFSALWDLRRIDVMHNSERTRYAVPETVRTAAR